MKIPKFGLSLGAATLSSLYQANVGAGVVELIPDNLPFAGHLVEFTPHSFFHPRPHRTWVECLKAGN